MQIRTETIWPTVVFSLWFAVGQPTVSTAAEIAQKNERPKLYDTQADGKEQIAAALKSANSETKRVLLKFGANW